MRINLLTLAIAFLAALGAASWPAFAQESGETVLAQVNGKNITQGDLEFLVLSRRIPKEQSAIAKERLLEILIERQLMREFLASRKAKPSQTELDEQVARILKLIQDGGDVPETVLAKMGMTKEKLREELALPLAWTSHLRLIVTNQKLREYFEKRRPQFDGTLVRVRQIFLKLSADAEEKSVADARMKLEKIRQEIEQGSITFADAAQKHSEAPSNTAGGDTGWITYRGKLPAAVSDAAFTLKDGEISEPVRSPFGYHLVTVTERKPGELSLEDVRAVVFNELSQELWQEQVKALREKATIEIRPAP